MSASLCETRHHCYQYGNVPVISNYCENQTQYWDDINVFLGALHYKQHPPRYPFSNGWGNAPQLQCTVRRSRIGASTCLLLSCQLFRRKGDCFSPQHKVPDKQNYLVSFQLDFFRVKRIWETERDTILIKLRKEVSSRHFTLEARSQERLRYKL